MVFSSTVFLFLFLPVVLLLYALLPRVLKNSFLLLASLFFYAWGESFFVLVMLASIAGNYLLGLLIAGARNPLRAKGVVAAAVALNLGMLVFFKYANFLVDNLNLLLGWLSLQPVHLDPVHLPIGISFFTFQAMTYVIDVYRGTASVQRNPIHVATYIALFPQLIAGPIVRYADIARQLVKRRVGLTDYAAGASRFTVGLGKKMLIANTLAEPVDQIFNLAPSQLTPGMAWLGVIYYALQIYFDFSGYSDMAIGLGRMFGFHFLENFNYPYISRSIREFWQRWHISLSTWFRDYLYIPLGGSRCAPRRVYLNLVTVFLLCGLWHGASWNFVVWGLFHGAFLVAERMDRRRRLERLPAPVRLAYVWLAVLVSWVFFRAETLSYALHYLGVMVGWGGGDGLLLPGPNYWNRELLLTLVAGVIGATPVLSWCRARWGQRGGVLNLTWATAHLLALAAILFFSALKLAAGTHNPFIYFRF